MRILGIDYGRARLGLAISDEPGKVALPLATLAMSKPLVALEQIRRIVGEKDVGAIVVGLPLNFKMKETEETRRARIFANTLKTKFNFPVHLENEIFSTRLFETPGRPTPKRRRQRGGLGVDITLDALAAADILQRYLDRVEQRANQP